MAKHKVVIEYKCQQCEGTGLYTGMAEGEGVAVQCRTCEGTGKAVHEFAYEDFTGRVPKDGVKRVLRCNPGVMAGAGNGHRTEDFGGMTYEAWAAGEPFPPGSEMRKFTCPAWWYQSADCDKKPDWKECGWGMFSACEHFFDKDRCWARWDREFGGKGD